MELMYKEWLRQNNEENKRARKQLEQLHQVVQPPPSPLPSTSTTMPIPSTSRSPPSPIPSTSAGNSIPSTSTIVSDISSEKFIASNPSDIVYQKDGLQLIVEKGIFQRQKKFSLQDHLFYIKIHQIDENRRSPLLKDLLNFLEIGFKFVLESVNKFYKKEDHNIAFLSLHQSPMITALNSGGFDLHEKTGAAEMVDRILTMLSQFLISNQTLELNQTFKLYLKILSLDSIKFKNYNSSKKTKKRTPLFYQNRHKHIGARRKANKNFNYFWALDVPNSFPRAPENDIFKEKCLLTSCILGILQNHYYKTNKKDKRYIKAQYINSSLLSRKNVAGQIILDELNEIFLNTSIVPNGPYELFSTAKILSEVFQCQIIVFDGINGSKKISFMYPSIYNDSLMPIYLYEPIECPSHFVFIRHINSYFRSNVKVCFACSKTFKANSPVKHLCPKKPTCFCCRRFFQSQDTYIHDNLQKQFCNKNVTADLPVTCTKCNLTLFSQHCLQGHKRFCYGKGLSFGKKCNKCNVFTYKGSSVSNIINHKCGQLKACKFCFDDQDLDHLCKLKKEVINENWPRIAFLGSASFENLPEKCTLCIENKKCCQHENNVEKDFEFELFLFIVYREEKKRGLFTRFVMSLPDLNLNDKKEDILQCDYFKNIDKHPFQEYNKTKKQTTDFERNYEQLMNNNNPSLMSQLLKLTMDKDFANTTYLCQNNDSTTFMYLLKGFLDFGFLPEVIRKGRQILLLEIKQLGLRFLTSTSYLAGNEYQIADQFNISFEKHYFPFKFLIKENLNYVGCIPDLKYFLSSFDSYLNETEKKNYYSLYNKNQNWEMKEQLVIHYNQKMYLLCMAFLRFMKESFDFQLLANCHQILNPISYPLCSLSGFTYKLFKLMYLNDESIYSVKNEFSVPMHIVSKMEFEFTSYMHYKFPDLKFISEFSNPTGQKVFKSCVPDLYSPVSLECFFFNGCFFHSHMNCLINPNANENSIRFGKTYKEINEAFEAKISLLLLENSVEVKKITIIWECQFLEMKKTIEIANFFKNIYIEHPRIRLIPRMAVRNAYFDVFNLKFDKLLFPNYELKFVDLNSHYTFIASEYKFMVGKYIILMGENLSKLKIVNNKFFYDNKSVLGSLLVSIIPPQNLMFPFLPYRTKSGQTINTLCRTCAEQLSKICNHSPDERMLTGCYMITEIEFALGLNYDIKAIFEAHVYENSKYILRPYIKMINFLKMKHSNCLKECLNDFDKQVYCNVMNNEMNFESPFLLTPTNIEPNRSKQLFYKLMGNSIIGKLGQRNDKNKTIFVNDMSQIENIYFSPNKIEDIFFVNDNFCQVEIKPEITKIPPNRLSSCYLEAQLTSYARELIYQHVMTVVNSGGIVFNVDCDSIIFAQNKNTPCPLKINDSIGNFKHELGNVDFLSFHSLGPKNYSLSFLKDNKIETISKVRGLSLSSITNQILFNEELFQQFIGEYFNDKKVECKIPQYRLRANYKKLKICSNVQLVRFTNDISTRRYLKKGLYVTFPYGFQ